MLRLSYIPLAFVWIFWSIFLISFFLPAYDGLSRAGREPDTSLLGWQAMVESIIVLTVKFWAVLFEPRFAVFFLAPFGNALVLVTPFVARSLREDSWPIAAPLVLFSAMMWFLPAEIYEHTRYGFWVWNLSALMMAVAVVFNAITMRRATRQPRRYDLCC